MACGQWCPIELNLKQEIDLFNCSLVLILQAVLQDAEERVGHQIVGDYCPDSCCYEAMDQHNNVANISQTGTGPFRGLLLHSRRHYRGVECSQLETSAGFINCAKPRFNIAVVRFLQGFLRLQNLCNVKIIMLFANLKRISLRRKRQLIVSRSCNCLFLACFRCSMHREFSVLPPEKIYVWP